MKILHTVEFYSPASNGMQQVVKQLSEWLVKAGHSVTVATAYDSERKDRVINGVKVEEFRISGKGVSGYDAQESEIKRYENFLINSAFDIITNFAAQQWATDLMLPLLQKISAVKVFVPTGFSELNNLKFKAYYESMKASMKLYDMNVFLSNNYQDINFARENGVSKTVLISNGASAEEFIEDPSMDIRSQFNIPANHLLILHVGTHTGLKGHREAIKIFKKAKLDNATFLIVGNQVSSKISIVAGSKFIIKTLGNFFTYFSGKVHFPFCWFTCHLQMKLFNFSFSGRYKRNRLLVKDLTRKETIAAYMEADLFLFPSNIECSPIVLFEAMASKTPFLTTDVGNAKEIISWSKSGLLLPTQKLKSGLCMADVDKSAGMLKNICKDGALREEMKKNGFKVWQKEYTWENISSNYESLYYSLLRERGLTAGIIL